MCSTISGKAISNSLKVLKNSSVSAGNISINFEKELSKKLSLKNPVSVNSGTSALHLGLNIAGISRGDEVILPAQTFIASGMSVLMTGAKPVFADIQYKTRNIDPESIRKKISKKTKAIIPVHRGGYPCDRNEILKIAK